MAEPKKKQNGQKTAGKSKTSKSAAAAKRTPWRREFGALVCLFLGIFSFLGYFNISAIFIDFFCGLVKGLIGSGFYLLPPALFVCAGILAFHRGRPVAMRTTCTLLIPVVVGALFHLAFCDLEFDFTWGMFSQLWETGVAAASGGVISGFLTVSLEALVSGVGAGIVYVVGLVFLGLVMCNTGISEIVDWLKNRERAEYEPEPELEKRPARPLRPSARQTIDIPVDEPPALPKPKPVPEQLPFERNEIVLPKPNVKMPDAFWETTAPEPEPGMPPDLQPEALIAEDPIATEEFSTKTVEKPARKLNPAEVAAESENIAKSIEERLAEEPPVYTFPPLSLLRQPKGPASGGEGEMGRNANLLSSALESFGIEAKISNATRGPSVTRYELELEAGVKLNKLTNLADDLALSLGASGVRIAPVPNKISTVGIEVPNKLVSVVALREVIASNQFQTESSKLTFSLGKDISGTCIVGNIAKLPHLLIAGTTGSGKSVCMNSLILSVLYKARPDEVKFIMIDPKMVEFGVYNGIPHLLIPVVTDPKKAAGALQWGVMEMLKRYKLFSEIGVRDLAGYNLAAEQEPERRILPQIVVVIDELADLMLVASKEVEESICRIAQMGRASGIHLVIATQRPSADVITGLMKANIPSRIALAVSSALESRIILDGQGAEKLVGNGDMLYKPVGANKPTRLQGTFVSDGEREKVIEFLKASGDTQYSEDVIKQINLAAEKSGKGGSAALPELDQADGETDEMFPEAAEVVLELGQASVSMLQRKLKLGYSRAARLMDQMEEAGIVGPFEGSKPRQILITREEWDARRAGNAQ